MRWLRKFRLQSEKNILPSRSKEMAGMRDILSHEYFGINHMVVWNVVDKKLPPLVRDLREMVRDIDDAHKTISDFFK